MRAVLVDAGPLIALVDRSDPHHAWAKRVLAKIRDPLLTVLPALTEALYLAGFSVDAQAALLTMVALDAPALAPLAKDDLPRIGELMKKYADLPMDFADAALVRVAEREGISRVVTTDRRDFAVYAAKGIGPLTLLS